MPRINKNITYLKQQPEKAKDFDKTVIRIVQARK